MKVCVRDCHLEQVVGGRHDLARCPGKADLAVARASVPGFLYAFDERHGLLNTSTQFADGLLRVRVLWRHLSGKPTSRALYVVAGTLDLIDEWLLVGCESTVQKHTNIELFDGSMLLGLI